MPSLLLPVQRAAEQCAWLQDMVSANEIYHPLRWTPLEALRLLSDVTKVEAAGIVMRTPGNWLAGKPARLLVTANIGGKPPSTVGMDSLLDFSMSVTLGGEALTSIDSLVELLQGKLAAPVMARITTPKTGLFPAPSDIGFDCDCPDGARMCKRVAAVLYGVGARLDEHPELLFKLRQVDAKDLVAQAVGGLPTSGKKPVSSRVIDDADLADVFGLEMDETPVEVVAKAKTGAKSRVPAKAKPAVKPTIEIPATAATKATLKTKPKSTLKAAVKKRRTYPLKKSHRSQHRNRQPSHLPRSPKRQLKPKPQPRLNKMLFFI